MARMELMIGDVEKQTKKIEKSGRIPDQSGRYRIQIDSECQVVCLRRPSCFQVPEK